VSKHSAGIVPYRVSDAATLEILLVHPGGPYWARRDEGAWSIPKGEYNPAEEKNPLRVAEREFQEELGSRLPAGDRVELGDVTQPGGKRIVAWAARCDVDARSIVSNEFEIEWPPRSGKRQTFPEVDRAAWFSVADARVKLLRGQVPLVDRLADLLPTP
jgi:predicted NUDIX family NTP pyrophosphohydrolase